MNRNLEIRQRVRLPNFKLVKIPEPSFLSVAKQQKRQLGLKSPNHPESLTHKSDWKILNAGLQNTATIGSWQPAVVTCLVTTSMRDVLSPPFFFANTYFPAEPASAKINNSHVTAFSLQDQKIYIYIYIYIYDHNNLVAQLTWRSRGRITQQ